MKMYLGVLYRDVFKTTCLEEKLHRNKLAFYMSKREYLWVKINMKLVVIARTGLKVNLFVFDLEYIQVF